MSIEKRGRQRFYQVNGEGVRAVHEWAAPFERFWTQHLTSIRARAKRRARELSTQEKSPMNMIEQDVQKLRVTKSETIAATPDVVWEAILHQMGPGAEFEPGKPTKMTLEAFPGGRWWRDLGDNTGHLWAHVQVIKPNKLLELSGPLFMSYAATSHIQYKLVPDGTKTRLEFVHTAIGLIPAEHSSSVGSGWGQQLTLIRGHAERSAR